MVYKAMVNTFSRCRLNHRKRGFDAYRQPVFQHIQREYVLSSGRLYLSVYGTRSFMAGPAGMGQLREIIVFNNINFAL